MRPNPAIMCSMCAATGYHARDGENRRIKNIPIDEGTCLRTERAFTFMFAEDPFFPLFIAFRRHHTSVRIFVDLMLFYFGATLEEAVQIYEKELI